MNNKNFLSVEYEKWRKLKNSAQGIEKHFR